MLRPEFTGQFKRDYKLAIKRGCNPKKLEEVVTMLCMEQPLPKFYQDHALTNSKNYKDLRGAALNQIGCLFTRFIKKLCF